MSPHGIAPTLTQRLAHQAARALGALPPAAQVRLSGRPPITVDGDRLAPELQLALAVMHRSATGDFREPSAEEARRGRRRLAAVLTGRPAPVGAVHDLEIDAGVALRARHYTPPEPGGPHPLLVYFHGGGFITGDLDTHDGLCRLLCRHGGAHVLSVDYRLAPEHPFPAAVHDAQGALRWAQAHAQRLGADPARVGVGGDSAGGTLAAVAAQCAAQDEELPPALQLLIYPVTDFSGRRRPSRGLFGRGFLLDDAELDWIGRTYLGADAAHAADPRASPMLASDLSGLAPAVIATAWFDPLRDEAEDYAAALRAAGTPVVLRRFSGLNHAFVATTAISRTARDAVVEIGGATRGLFATVSSTRSR